MKCEGAPAGSVARWPLQGREKAPFRGQGQDATCSVCLADMVKGEAVKELPACRHCFHAACIDEWIKRSAACPLCKRDVLGPKAPPPRSGRGGSWPGDQRLGGRGGGGGGGSVEMAALPASALPWSDFAGRGSRL